MNVCRLFSLILLCHSIAPAVAILKIVLVGGQSNCQGQGDKFHLQELITGESTKDIYGKYGTDEQGEDGTNIATRYDVHVTTHPERKVTGPLTARFGDTKTHFGIEMGMGFVLGDYFESNLDGVLIVKYCKVSPLATGWRPPSSGNETTGVSGAYNGAIQLFRDVLNNPAQYYPYYDGSGFDVLSFVWFHGYADAYEEEYLDEYELNLENLLQDMNREFPEIQGNVVLQSGGGGETPDTGEATLREIQSKVAAQLKNNTVLVETFQFSGGEPRNDETYVHYFGRADNYIQIGEATGRAVISYLQNTVEADSPDSVSLPVVELTQKGDYTCSSVNERFQCEISSSLVSESGETLGLETVLDCEYPETEISNFRQAQGCICVTHIFVVGAAEPFRSCPCFVCPQAVGENPVAIDCRSDGQPTEPDSFVIETCSTLDCNLDCNGTAFPSFEKTEGPQSNSSQPVADLSNITITQDRNSSCSSVDERFECEIFSSLIGEDGQMFVLETVLDCDLPETEQVEYREAKGCTCVTQFYALEAVEPFKSCPCSVCPETVGESPIAIDCTNNVQPTAADRFVVGSCSTLDCNLACNGTVLPTLDKTDVPSNSSAATIAPSMIPSNSSIPNVSDVSADAPSSAPMNKTGEPPYVQNIYVLLEGISEVLTDTQQQLFMNGSELFLKAWDSTVKVDFVSQSLLPESRRSLEQRGLQSARVEVLAQVGSWNDEAPGETAIDSITREMTTYIDVLKSEDIDTFESVSGVNAYFVRPTQAPATPAPPSGPFSDPSGGSSGSSDNTALVVGIVLLVVVLLVAILMTRRFLRISRRSIENHPDQPSYEDHYNSQEEDLDESDAFIDEIID